MKFLHARIDAQYANIDRNVPNSFMNRLPVRICSEKLTLSFIALYDESNAGISLRCTLYVIQYVYKMCSRATMIRIKILKVQSPAAFHASSAKPTALSSTEKTV